MFSWRELVQKWSQATGMRPFKSGKHAKGHTKSPTWRRDLLAKRKRERQARKEMRAKKK